ncbi:tail tape measure protein [Sphingomonas sp. NPDC079357]|uniref:tail tape measure protein n=1 Tax=Sphingomonas sp. NPDC079357 TaxID=3364518 RepID=UPI003850E077
MDDEIERLVIGVRADTGGFARDVAAMRATLEGGLGTGAERAGRAVETALARAVRTGKLGFDDLKSVALHALGEIAAAALRDGVSSVLGGGGGLTRVLGGLLGLPGRATGGPVSPGRAYLVGERGPEVFVPTTSGQVAVPAGGGARDVRIAITINAGGAGAPEAMARSSRQVARAVRAALMEAE